MRVKKVNRYYCEYCKKSSCSARLMKKHEESCTMNPNRHCGFCDLLEKPQPDLQEIIVMLPDPELYKRYDEHTGSWYFYGLSKELKETLPKLRDATENCPACIMAALRQRGIPVSLAEEFHFGKECQAVWDGFNARKEAQVKGPCYL